MVSTTTAAVINELHGAFDIQELTLDEPRPDEVQVRMVAAGVCHTDMAVRDGWIPTTFPIVLGHEGEGSSSEWAAPFTICLPEITWC